MTTQEIKELLDKYRKEIYHVQKEPVDRDDICRSIGFQDCQDLLLPLVEALEFYAGTKNSIFEVVDEGRNYSTHNVIYESDLSPEGKMDQPLGTKAHQSLNTLVKKLGG